MKRELFRKSFGMSWVLILLLACGASPSHAYQQDLKKMAIDLAARIHSAKHSRVTVVDFVDLDSNPTKLGKFLAQQLQLNLAEPEHKLEVVDQSQISHLMDQIEKLNEGLLDPATGRKLGQMAGTEVIVLGTVMPSSMTVRVDIKAIDLQTAKVITGASTSVARLGVVDKLLAQDSPEEAPQIASASAQPAASPKKGPQGPARTRRDQGMTFDLEGCSLDSGGVTCAMTVTSDDRDRWFSVTFDSRAWTEAGEEFGPGEVMIANTRSSRDCAVKQVLEDVPTRLTLRFPNFGDEAELVERLRVYWGEDNNCWNFERRPVNFEKIAFSEETDFGSSQAANRPGKGEKNVSGQKGKQTGGLMQRLGGHVLSIVEDAATKVIDKETRKLVGDDEEEDQDPPKNP